MGLPNSLVANLDCTGMAAIGATCGCFAAEYWIRGEAIGCKPEGTAAREGRQPSPRRHGGHGEDLGKSQKQNDHGATRISRIKESSETSGGNANRGSGAHFLLTCFLSSTPGVNLATFRAAILMTPPVRGLRPLRALRWETENVPKPTSVTRSPFLSASVTASIRVSMAAAALVLVMPVEAAIFSTRSPLFMMAPRQVANSSGRYLAAKPAPCQENPQKMEYGADFSGHSAATGAGSTQTRSFWPSAVNSLIQRWEASSPSSRTTG